MKIRHLLLGMLAMAATVACNQEEPVVTPELDLNKTSASVGAEGGSVALEVTSNVDWTASADQDWVSVDPVTGEGAEEAAKVTVSVEPNEAEEARTATVTVKAEKLTKTLKITQAGATGKEPEPEPEPEVAWSMMGCFVDNQWASDVPMAQEGEWIVAKGAEFTELTFKIRGNASWDDATNIGYAPGTEKGLVNAKLSVVTAEYSKANLGGDAADIKLNGLAGTYDVYFSFENLEVYVMEEGYKPGEREPVPAEPKEVTYTVAGTIADHAWDNNYAGGLMVAEGDYFVAKNVPFVWNSTLYGGEFNVIELKIVETGTWDAYAYPEKDVMQQVNTEVSLIIGGENVAFAAPEGTYDVYFDKANAKLWVMTPGLKPGETPEPAEYEIEGKQWVGTLDFVEGPVVFDLGYTEEGAMIVAAPDMDGTSYVPHMLGTFEVVKTDGTSGKILFTQYDPDFDEFYPEEEYEYANLNETTVDVIAAAFGGTVSLTLADKEYEIMLGGGNPQGAIQDGAYWFIEPVNQKVMMPLDETYTYGRPKAADAINGASTAANAYTFTYDPDWTAYTIQDSYGRYLYQDMKTADTPYNTLSVAESLPMYYDQMDSEQYESVAPKDNYAYYMWEVWDNGDGTFEVASKTTYFSFGYSPSYNNWELRDAWDSDFSNFLPKLVPADFPVEEPADPEEITEEKVIWDGSHNVANWSGNQDLAWDGFDWSTVKAGCRLKLYVTPNNPSSDWWCISLRSAAEGWPNLAGIPAQYDKPSYSITLDLTQALLDEIKTGNGLIFTGSETTVTKISLLPADAEVSIWEGSMTSNGYSNCQIGTVNDWINNGAAPGDKVRIYVTGGEGWALQISDPQWKKWFATGSDGSQEGLYGYGFNSYNSSLDKGYLEFDITAEMAATIVSYNWGNALIIQGDKIEVTKISIL